MLPAIPQGANNWLSQPSAQAALGSFPPNLVPYIPEDLQQRITRYILQNYAWPQVMERTPFENMWANILNMYRIKMDKINLNIDEASKAGADQQEDISNTGSSVRVADSVVFDSIERLTDITHFILFKEGLPIQYNIPKYYDNRGADSFYNPFRDKIKSANCLLAWNFDNEDIYRKSLIIARHFYTYGVAFVRSEFAFDVAQMQRQMDNGMRVTVPEITKIGTTFDPINITKLWLNTRLNAYDMDYQPCPFFFEETPRFATLQNAYNPQINPFGFANLDKVQQLGDTSWLFSGAEMQAVRKALEGVVGLDDYKNFTVPNLLTAKHSVEALWTFYPMLPLDPQTLEFETRQDGTAVPFSRYIVNTFGQNLLDRQILLRIQRNFYPRDQVPIYGTSHLPDMDSGLYTPSLGYLLWNHYKEIVTCKNQYLSNKDWINNPPAWVLASSPASQDNLSKAGNKIIVNGPNDFGYRAPYDATQSTVAMMQALRDQAKTSAKSEDALLGKALGGRTSATEAQNVFQAAMSAVTTPINLFNYDIMGGYATRVWEYTATWFPPTLLKEITGQMGFALTPQDLWMRVGLKWDIGSSYIESIVRQQNIRYILESSINDPTINRPSMWKELLEEMRFDTAADWVNDGGFEREVYIATQQAIQTFYGKPVIINPDQNHQIAIKVKTRFLEDQDSVWMQEHGQMAPEIVKQIEQHQYFLMLQLQQQMLMARMNPQNPPQTPHALGGIPSNPPLNAQVAPATPGQVMQQGGPSGG